MIRCLPVFLALTSVSHFGILAWFYAFVGLTHVEAALYISRT